MIYIYILKLILGGTTLLGTYNYPITNTTDSASLLSSSWKKIRSYANDLFDIAINNEER